MKEERLLILKMIAEGKITAEEGAALIDALENGTSSPEESHFGDFEARAGRQESPGFEPTADKDFSQRLEEEASRFADNVQRAAEKYSRVLEERIQRDIKPALANMPNWFAQFPVIARGFGPTITDEETHSGELLGNEVEVGYSGNNGHLEVVMWEESGYRFECQKVLKGAVGEEERRENALVIDVGPGRLEAGVKSGSCLAMNTRLFLPRDRWYKLRLRTSNGWIRLQDIVGGLMEVHSSNGRLQLRNITAEKLILGTSNGAIDCSAVKAGQFEAVTSNGRIEARVSARDVRCRTSNGAIELHPLQQDPVTLDQNGRYELITSNGSITVAVPRDLLAVTGIEAKTGFGAIQIESDVLQIKTRDEKIDNKFIVAQGERYGTAEHRLDILARTSNSHIAITEA